MIAKCIKAITKSNLVAEENKSYDIGYCIDDNHYNIFEGKDLSARLTELEFLFHFQVTSYMRNMFKLERYGDYYYNPNSLLLCQ